MATIITMASLSIGGAFLERILNKMGETDKAQIVGIVTTGTLIVTAVGTIIKVFSEVKKLG